MRGLKLGKEIRRHAWSKGFGRDHGQAVASERWSLGNFGSTAFYKIEREVTLLFSSAAF